MQDHPADVLEAGVAVAAHVDFGLRDCDRGGTDEVGEGLLVGNARFLPVDVAPLVNRDGDVLRLGHGRDVAGLGQVQLHRLGDHRDGDQEDDQQHEHDVHERRGVDRREDLVFPIAVARWNVHAHDAAPTRSMPLLLARSLRAGATTDQCRVQVVGEVAQLVQDGLVPAQQPVVAQHRGHGDCQTDGGHDERLADGARHLVDAGLAGNADRDEGVVDAPHRAEEADERGGGAHRRQEGQAALQVVGHAVHVLLQLAADPFGRRDVLGQLALVSARWP